MDGSGDLRGIQVIINIELCFAGRNLIPFFFYNNPPPPNIPPLPHPAPLPTSTPRKKKSNQQADPRPGAAHSYFAQGGILRNLPPIEIALPPNIVDGRTRRKTHPPPEWKRA